MINENLNYFKQLIRDEKASLTTKLKEDKNFNSFGSGHTSGEIYALDWVLEQLREIEKKDGNTI